MFDTLGDQVGQDLGMESGAAGNKGSAGRFDQLGYVEVLFDRRIRSVVAGQVPVALYAKYDNEPATPAQLLAEIKKAMA